MTPDLDHLAVGVRSITQALPWVPARLGGHRHADFTEASWHGIQFAFAGGIRLEALEPIANPRDDFLDRFLVRSGDAPHHVTFKVPDIEATLARMEGIGIQPLKVDLSDPNWREAFLHPRLGLGTVVQVAQAGGVWAAQTAAPDVDRDLPRAEFLGAELRSEPGAADRVFGDLLEGRRTTLAEGVLYAWPGGGSLLVRRAEPPGGPHVERVVFRLLSPAAGSSAGPGEEPLWQSRARLRVLGPGEAWPSPGLTWPR